MEKIKEFVKLHPEFVCVKDALESIETLDGIKQQKIVNALNGLIKFIDEHQMYKISEFIDDLKTRKQHHISEIFDITNINVNDQPCVDALENALKHRTYKEAAHVIDDIICIKDIKSQITILSMIS